jgi:hypothetical protein
MYHPKLKPLEEQNNATSQRKVKPSFDHEPSRYQGVLVFKVKASRHPLRKLPSQHRNTKARNTGHAGSQTR